jgi:type II secretory pathway component PulM
MKMKDAWKSLPPRSRVLLVAAAIILPLVATYHAAVRPLLRSINARNARIEANARVLQFAMDFPKGEGVPRALAGKTLEPLSAASIVDALTETAHANAIRRIAFKTGAVEGIKASASVPATAKRLQRMPVSVKLETSPGAFVAYLDGLNTLSFPLSVEEFEMKRNRQAGAALVIRLELEVYGERA